MMCGGKSKSSLPDTKFWPWLGLILLSLLLWWPVTLMADSGDCRQECDRSILLKMARGGFSDEEVALFCRPKGANPPSQLRKTYAVLEDKNWRTHYYQQATQEDRRLETVHFQVGETAITVKSSNPNAQYYDFQDLGDGFRVKRRQPPYSAVYTLTFSKDEIRADSLSVNQSYKTSRNYRWKAVD